MTQAVCCGGGDKYDVEEPKCKRGTFEFKGNPGTKCSNFDWAANVGEFIYENSGPSSGGSSSTMLHTARLKDGKYYSVSDLKGDRSNKVDSNKLDERGYYYSGENEECSESGADCTFRDWNDMSSNCQCKDTSTNNFVYGGTSRVENCGKCCLDDDDTCGMKDPETCNPDLCCYGCGMMDSFGHGSSSSSSSSGPTGPPTIADATYAEYAYGLPEGFYENCTTTQAEAIAMFTKYNELHDPCEWTKFNGPFNCERAGPTGIGQRFSLAYANALLAYTVISATIVNIFYAKAKRRAEGKDVEQGADEVEHVPTEPTTQIKYADGTTFQPPKV